MKSPGPPGSQGLAVSEEASATQRGEGSAEAGGSGVGWSRLEEPSEGAAPSPSALVQWLLLAVVVAVVVAVLVALGVAIWLAHETRAFTG